MRKILVMGLVLVLVIGIFSLPTCASLKFKGGYFMPTQSIKLSGEKVPNNGIIYGAELTTTLTGGVLGLGIGADYFPWHKTIGDKKYTWDTASGSLTLYLFPSARFYLGVGAGYYAANAKGEEANILGYNIGYQGVIGWNITKHIFIEGKYSTCNVNEWKETNGGTVPSEFKEISDIGGITVVLGFGI